MSQVIATPTPFEPPAGNTRPLIIPSVPLETVKVYSNETESGFMIINSTDFDERIHKQYVDKSVVEPPEKPSRKSA